MQRIAGIGFIVIGVLHMALFLRDAAPELPGLLSGALWTTDHTFLPVAERDTALLRAEHAFWTTIGGAAIPLLAVGLLVLWIDRIGLRVPAAFSAVLLAWSTVGTALMQPSGYPLILAASLLLFLAKTGAAERAAGGVTAPPPPAPPLEGRDGAS